MSGGAAGLLDPLLGPVVGWLSQNLALSVLANLMLSAALALALHLWARWGRRKGLAARSPLLLTVEAGLLGLYGLGWLVDGVASLFAGPHPRLDAAQLARSGWVERFLLDGELSGRLLPLMDHPALALLLHLLLWSGLLLGGYRLARSLSLDEALPAASPAERAPWYYAATGCSSLRGLDACHRAWLRPLSRFLALALLLGLLAFSWAATDPAAAPSLRLPPGLLVHCGLVLLLLRLHLLAPAARPAAEPEAAPQPADPPAQRDPLAELEGALQGLVPGLAALRAEPRLPHPVPPGAWPPGLPPLLREALERRWGEGALPHRGQALLLETLQRALRLPSAAGEPQRELSSRGPGAGGSGAAPPLDAVLFCGAEGSGRSSALLAAVLLAQLQRGGSALLLCRSEARRDALAARMTELLASSALRWSLPSAHAGVDLRESLASGRLPALVLAELRGFEQDLLLDPRAEGLLRSLELVLVDELHEFVGPPEMHLGLSLQRLWLQLEVLGRSERLPPVLASAGPLFDEAPSWAAALLGRRVETLQCEGPLGKPRSLLWRSALRGAAGQELSLPLVARACETAGLPWHLRMSGDGKRQVQRADSELRALGTLRVDSPAAAAVVLLEGSFGEVRREVEVTRLLAQDARFASGLQIAAPPAEEEQALAPLAAGLPWLAVAPDPPPDLRARHLQRALAGRSLPAARLVDRVLRGADAGLVERLLQAGVLTEHGVARLPAGALQPERERWLSRAPAAPPLPELDPGCSGPDPCRLFDTGASRSLRSLDQDEAACVAYPGATLLLPEGRFRVALQPERGAGPLGSIAAQSLDQALRSVPERRWLLDAAALQALPGSERSLGGRRLRSRAGAVELSHEVWAVRLYAPGPRFAETRALEPPVSSELRTRALLLSCPALGAPLGSEAEQGDALAPLAAALSLALRSVLRAADALLQVGVVRAPQGMLLGFIDRGPGGNGAAAAVDGALLRPLLEMTLAVLEQPTERIERVRELHDERPGSEAAAWDPAGARAWLRALLPQSDAGPPEPAPVP